METKEEIRKSYIKPQINQVKLEIQEAVLLNCKSQTGTTAAAKNATICNVNPLCRQAPYGS